MHILVHMIVSSESASSTKKLSSFLQDCHPHYDETFIKNNTSKRVEFNPKSCKLMNKVEEENMNPKFKRRRHYEEIILN